MPNPLPDPELTELATGFTVRDYTLAVAARNKDGIADAIRRRFVERYLEPVTSSKHEHGFTMMAISCLMIESLESFQQGWPNSRDKSKAAFCYFFDDNDISRTSVATAKRSIRMFGAAFYIKLKRPGAGELPGNRRHHSSIPTSSWSTPIAS